jgi:hypothetical protein
MFISLINVLNLIFEQPALIELKDLRYGPYGLKGACFLDRFFLFLIYTEVVAVTQSFQGCLLESGRDKGENLNSPKSYLFIFPRQRKKFS